MELCLIPSLSNSTEPFSSLSLDCCTRKKFELTFPYKTLLKLAIQWCEHLIQFRYSSSLPLPPSLSSFALPPPPPSLIEFLPQIFRPAAARAMCAQPLWARVLVSPPPPPTHTHTFSAFLWFSLRLSIVLYISSSLCLGLSPSVCLCLSLSLCVSLSMALYPSSSLCLGLPPSLCVCLSVCPPPPPPWLCISPPLYVSRYGRP